MELHQKILKEYNAVQNAQNREMAQQKFLKSEDLLDQKLISIATAGGFDKLARQAIADYKAGKTIEI